MAVDNPDKYNALGGLHIERMTPEDAAADGFDPEKVWIVIAIKEEQDVKLVVVQADYALKIAEAIKVLAS